MKVRRADDLGKTGRVDYKDNDKDMSKTLESYDELQLFIRKVLESETTKDVYLREIKTTGIKTNKEVKREEKEMRGNE